MPNDPLRCFYYEAHAGAFQSCEEYGYTYDPNTNVDDTTPQDDGDNNDGDDGNNTDEWDFSDDDDWWAEFCGGEDWCSDWFDEGEDDQEDEPQDIVYPCDNQEYDHTAYNYQCYYDMQGELEYCECVLKITCLRDIWVYSTDPSEFWALFFANTWTIFVWFSIHDVMNYLTKSFH